MQPIVSAFAGLQEPLTAGAAPGDDPGADDRWRALARIMRHALTSSNEPELSGRLADGFLRLLGGETAAVFRGVAGKLDVLAVASRDTAPVEPADVSDMAYPMTRAIRERRPIAATAEGASSPVLAVPLHGRYRILGALTVMHRPDARFTPLDIEIAEAFADQAATFLELVWRSADRVGTGWVGEDSQKQVIEAERLRAVGQLAGGVAHHLNNIMTVILGNIHVALGSDSSVGMRNHLQTAERAVLEAAEVVRRMTAFSRMRPAPVGGVVDLNLLAADVLEWTRSRWQAEAQLRGVTIDARLEAGDVPPVRGDEEGLREVLLSLVLNAIDALPRGGDIVVRTWRGNTSVYCSVWDNGVGMTPETTERALEPFFTTKGPKSRGLGLSVAYGTVQRHSGTLAIDSHKGRGSIVTVALPIDSAGAGAPTMHEAAPSDALRVLVVDDDPAVRTVLHALLTRDGYTVVDAVDGADALDRVERGDSFDLVLTDLVMPGVNGWHVLRGVRQLRPALPVVLITGWEQIDPEGDDVADVIVTKPVTDVELRETLARVLGLRKSTPA